MWEGEEIDSFRRGVAKIAPPPPPDLAWKSERCQKCDMATFAKVVTRPTINSYALMLIKAWIVPALIGL
jgi:hypothetical protein